MALIKCPECGKEISDKAEKCPHCGKILQTKQKNIICPECKEILNENEKVCHKCGYPVLNKKTIKKSKSKILIVSFTILFLAIISFIIFWNATKDERMIKNDKIPPKFENIPESITTMIGEPIVFNDYLKENNVTVSDEVTKDMVYTIDDSTIDFNTPGSYQISISAMDEAGNTTTETINVTVNDYPTHKAFLQATNLTFDQLSSSGNSYSFDGIHISKEEANNIEDGSIYRSIAQQIEGYFELGEEYYGNWGNNLVPLIFTKEKTPTWEEYRDYLDKKILFITRKVNVGAIMSILDSLSTVDGNFEYENGVFSVQIPDLTATANELEITERMLGYILAMLQEYGTESTFDKNSYSCNLKFLGKRDIDSTDYISYENWVNEENQLDNMKKNGFTYYYQIDDYNELSMKINGIYTNRYLQLKHSIDAVIFSHGGGDVKEFQKDTDITYQSMLTGGNSDYVRLDCCTKYIAYNINDIGNIVYYFNEADELIFIMYSNVVVY